MGSVCHGYMHILLYMKLIQCSGVAQIYGQLEERVGSVFPGYMCILLYMKLIQCSGVAYIYGQIRGEGWGQSAMGICAFSYI